MTNTKVISMVTSKAPSRSNFSFLLLMFWNWFVCTYIHICTIKQIHLFCKHFTLLYRSSFYRCIHWKFYFYRRNVTNLEDNSIRCYLLAILCTFKTQAHWLHQTVFLAYRIWHEFSIQWLHWDNCALHK